MRVWGVPTAQQEYVVALHESGMHPTAIADRIQVCVQRVYLLLQEFQEAKDAGGEWYAGLSRRAANCLKNANCQSVEDVTKHTRAEILDTPNLGRASLREVETWLAAKGLKFRE